MVTLADFRRRVARQMSAARALSQRLEVVTPRAGALVGTLAVVLLCSAPTGAADSEREEEARLNELALALLVEGQMRVMAVADPIRIAAAPWCGKKVAPVIGAYAPDQHTLRDFYREVGFVDPFVAAAGERFGLRAEPRVVTVVPGMPADAAGLKAGDLVVGVDGKKFKRRLFLDLLQNRGKDGIVRLTVDRQGQRLELALEAKPGCTFASRFAFGTSINAYAMSFGSLTGMYIYAGLLRFLPDDDDLAVIVGHELAHLVLSHTSQRTLEANEAAADYVGLYFAARAGFDVSRASEVWDRFARMNPYASIDTGFYTHPVTAKRSLSLQAAVDEIEGKRARGEPLDRSGKRGKVVLPRVAEIDEAALESHVSALRKEALEVLRSDQRRIQDVSYRLTKAGASECGDRVAPILGATIARRKDFGRANAKEVAAAFGVGDDVTVLHVTASSPADRAGLIKGDRILAVDRSKTRRTTQVYKYLRASRAGDPRLKVRRGDANLEIVLPRELGCPNGTLVAAGGGTDTWEDGNRVEMKIPTGLLRFVRDDDELALVIAHQLGHHILKSFREGEDEPRADELGIAIAARAGFDVGKAPAFWDRWAAEQFWKISTDMDGSYIHHGAMSLRAPAIRAASESAKLLRPADD